MKLIKSLVGKIQETSERTTLAKLLWFVGMAYSFLWVPDLDLVFIGVLHHRSIVTHSILPAVLLLLLGRRAGAAPLAGAMIGLAVHLSCDLLSPAIGFGQILAAGSNKSADWPSDLPMAVCKRIDRLLDCETACHEGIHHMGWLLRYARRQ